ncbi:ABC transporter ATP-binding protein [Xanthobacter tagetidis]|uniref:ABC transporter ATP-binding protein n=1 Tax=Xanthobacter tagetidis TaxID=60216 RepID=A0A3L7AMX5_9HYPH|nr:ABC transporter ATP-binding protein [Xanthobacter tagetidis]MBB6307373.1 sn-glycerol 3-phosphate transport system ATP-binding protein [Xanthobacter tagetidis]RLP80971.1 ABC transporter ATP-binding protein [Xanthobacter tagetidis]
MSALGPDFVRLDGVTRLFPGGGGVADLSIAVPCGGFTVLLGPSGCGKSTTLRLIAGLETPDRGRVEIGGRDVTALAPSARGLSVVFQSYALFPHLSVEENIVFGLKVRRVPRAERGRKLAEALALTGLDGLGARRPAQLSGGQRQRVALARAIVADHPLCLMDEPLSNLDAKLRHAVRQDIRALQRRLGMTVIYVTHDQTEAMGMADQVILMRDGRVEQQGAPAALYERPASLFAAGFVGTPPMTLLPAALVPLPPPPGHAPARLVAGVRAEALCLAAPSAGLLPATVEASEFLGAETFVYLRLAGGAQNGAQVIARLPGRNEPAPGAAVSLGWDPAATHWFERDSGRRVPDEPFPDLPATAADPVARAAV